MKLEIGCGKNKREGCVGVDIISYPTVDHTLDLNVQRLPFTDESVDFIYSAHCLEHLTPQGFLFCLDEMYRVSKPNASWHIIVPYFNSTGTAANPYHTNNIFNEYTFYFFSKERGPEHAEYKVSKGTANENTKATVHVDSMNYLYFKDYEFLKNESEEEQLKTRLSKMNIALNIEYKLTVIK